MPKEKEATGDAFKNLDEEFEAIEGLQPSGNKDSIKKFEEVIASADKNNNYAAKIDCMEELVAQVNQVEDGDEMAKMQMSSSPKKSD